MIAIAIITYNRPESFSTCISKHEEFTPPNSKLFIVDGGSDTDYATTADYKFTERVNISTVKNKALQLCYESGVEHVFIYEDDAYPIKKDWHLAYVESREHHLCATFLRSNKTYTKHVTILESDNLLMSIRVKLKTHLLGNGCMLYFTRECINKIGGFDTNYNNKYEHCDLSRRIYNARLTDNIYQDIQGSDKLIYCLDQDNAVARSFTNREMQDNLKAGYEYFRSREDSSDYVEFRT